MVDRTRTANWQLQIAVLAIATAGAISRAAAQDAAGSNDDKPHVAERIEAAHAKAKAVRDRIHDRIERIADRVVHESAVVAQEIAETVREAKQQGKSVAHDAQDAVADAKNEIKQDIDGAKSASARKEAADAARRAAFQHYAGHVRRPSEIPAAARAELRVHSRRMARLARVRTLAEYAHDEHTMRRVAALSEREEARHRVALAAAFPQLSEPARAADDPGADGRRREDDDDPENEP